MDPEKLVEAAFRGLMSALVGAGSSDPRKATPRRRRAGSSASSPRAVSPTPPPDPTQPMLFDDVTMAPPVTQDELDKMERMLRGEPQPGARVPGEGDNAWMGS